MSYFVENALKLCQFGRQSEKLLTDGAEGFGEHYCLRGGDYRTLELAGGKVTAVEFRIPHVGFLEGNVVEGGSCEVAGVEVRFQEGTVGKACLGEVHTDDVALPEAKSYNGCEGKIACLKVGCSHICACKGGACKATAVEGRGDKAACVEGTVKEYAGVEFRGGEVCHREIALVEYALAEDFVLHIHSAKTAFFEAFLRDFVAVKIAVVGKILVLVAFLDKKHCGLLSVVVALKSALCRADYADIVLKT